MRSFWQKLRRKFREIAFYEHWMIGIVDAPVETSLHWQSCPPPRWLGPESDRFYHADPFAWPGDAATIFCEEYDFKTRTGSIVRLAQDENGITHRTPIPFPVPGHLSFPFLFAHENEVYCLPESGAAKRMVIFKWHEGNFREYAAPLENVTAADSIFFTHQGLFWIAYTDTGLGTSDNLNLLFATTPQGPWQAHPANPVKRGNQHSRNAGPVFKKDGMLYRPAQDCSQTYGGAIRIQRIVECTPERYSEAEAAYIMPVPGIYRHGLHTLSPFGNQTLIDGKRLVFSLTLLFRKVLRRLTKDIG